MSKLKLFIADVDEAHTERVIRCVARRRDIEIVGTERNGAVALRRIAELRPDVLLTDIQLPGLDGIFLLKDLRALSRPPIVIVCTQFYSELCVRGASQCGACYFLYKPVDYNRLPELIAACGANARAVRHEAPENAEALSVRAPYIRGLLTELGIPAKLCGSQYLIESVICLDRNASLLRNLSKGLYADVAAQMHTTPTRVERSLRSAISVGYDRGAMREVFPERPSNKAFIEYLLRRVREGANAREASAKDFVY